MAYENLWSEKAENIIKVTGYLNLYQLTIFGEQFANILQIVKAT